MYSTSFAQRPATVARRPRPATLAATIVERRACTVIADTEEVRMNGLDELVGRERYRQRQREMRERELVRAALAAQPRPGAWERLRDRIAAYNARRQRFVRLRPATETNCE
jgi:hypothetical protein